MTMQGDGPVHPGRPPVPPPSGPASGPPSVPPGAGGPPFPPVPAPAPEPPGGGSSHRGMFVGLAVVLVAVLAAAFVVLGGDDEFGQSEGEVLLEPTASQGPDAFTGEIFVEPLDPEAIAVTTTEAETTTTTAPGGAAAPDQATPVATDSGGRPGLYGGTRDSARCDPTAIADFLEANTDKAQAWVDALNSDPSLQWAGGNSLTVADIRDYIAELTPVTLTYDTRVTNYGFRNEKPTPRQAVLERGTSVLVDRYGVPRAKCACGNPLTQPQPVQQTPVFTGEQWPRFQPTTIIVVTEVTVEIDVFILVDVFTGETFDRPAGTTGAEDADPLPTTLDVAVTASQVPSDDVATGATVTVAWTGSFDVAEDGTIAGLGSGTTEFTGTCFRGDDPVSDASASGSYEVTLTGLGPAEEPTYDVTAAIGTVALDSLVIPNEPDTTSGCYTDFQTGGIFDVLTQPAFGALGVFPEGTSTFTTAGGFEGEITLTAAG